MLTGKCQNILGKHFKKIHFAFKKKLYLRFQNVRQFQWLKSYETIQSKVIMIYKSIINAQKQGRKVLSVLLDPDKQNLDNLKDVIRLCNEAEIDYILIGGSLITISTEPLIKKIKRGSDIPVVLFPGSVLQVSNQADGILLLSLISGRNPELLIGDLVKAAPFLKNSNLEIISTGYMLIDGGKQTSVGYMSNTRPIPADKYDIAVATALAGEMLGMKQLYLDAGSGADSPVPPEMISEVRKNTHLPLIVGGGLKSEENIYAACKSGADMIVLGSIFESDGEKLPEFSKIVHQCVTL